MTFNDNVTKQFAVNWNNHMNHVRKAFDQLLKNSEFTDVTLYADGKKIGAHKMLLSACSIYFRNLFLEFPQEHPLVVLKGVKFSVLVDILKFIYSGEVSVDSDVFEIFLQTAEFLQISGLTNSGKNGEPGKIEKSLTRDFYPCDTNLKTKKAKQNSFEDHYGLHKEEPTECFGDTEYVDEEPKILSSIFAGEISDQEKSQFPSEILLQTASENNYQTIAKVDEETTRDHYFVSAGSVSTTHKTDNLTCPICHKVFTHPYSLHHHKPVHLGRTKCTICNVVLSRKYNLKMHMKSRHNIV
ncbi:uncharacterized protein [Leptinotarsa decemlineata]|uniref:uncharacterized protein n=1 Tax=Leptinotarsa decemlineata TaxID=7539 RepID=UPI000C25574B|nr:zinc finger and BTB domain-containing protein 24-like [Leptinotarsa decemlineata]